MAANSEHGHGRVVLHNDGTGNVFSHLYATYPLKLISPQLSSPNLSIIYMLSYGGGLVGGDRIQLDVEVHDGAHLAILSQGSTKIFKTRPDQRLSTVSSTQATTQRMTINVAPNSALFLLPDPVTCFRSAQYHQVQTFHVAEDSSAVLLDWITSGRKSLGEEWVFSEYYSLNEVWVDGKRIARDAMLLEEREPSSTGCLVSRSLADSLAPYSCYANIIMHGNLVQDIIHQLTSAYSAITIFRQNAPPPLLWSISPIVEGKSAIVRVAAKETEDVKEWLRNGFHGLEKVLGIDVYRRIFS